MDLFEAMRCAPTSRRFTDQPVQPAVLRRVLAIIEAIGQRSAYFALLQENGPARARLVELCRHGDFLAAQIAAHPLLLDELIDERLLPLVRNALLIVKRTAGSFVTGASVLAAGGAIVSATPATVQAYTVALTGTPVNGETWSVTVGGVTTNVAVNAAGDEFAEDLLVRTLHESNGLTADELVREIVNAVFTFIGASLMDDVTVVAIRGV